MTEREAAGQAVEIGFLEGVRTRLGDDVPTLKALADLYTRAGRLADGLALDLRLAGLCPDDALVRYNLACSYAVTGSPDEAFDALSRAVELGYRDGLWMKHDEDLKTLRGDPRFQSLIERLAGRRES